MAFQKLELTVTRFPSKLKGQNEFYFLTFSGEYFDPDQGISIGEAQKGKHVRVCEYTDLEGAKKIFAELADNFYQEVEKEKTVVKEAEEEKTEGMDEQEDTEKKEKKEKEKK